MGYTEKHPPARYISTMGHSWKFRPFLEKGWGTNKTDLVFRLKISKNRRAIFQNPLVITQNKRYNL